MATYGRGFLTVLLTVLVAEALAAAGESSCSPEELLLCVRMAQPLLNDPNLVFPDNMADVDKVCRHWREFVQCVKTYTGRCFSLTQQQEFVRAVQSPLGQAHRLCSDQNYQAEYLEHAFCIHSSIAEKGRCRQLHQYFVELVLGDVNEKQLCCAHHQFQECVQDEVGRLCTSAGKGELAKNFARELLDKAFSYIKTKCSDSDSAGLSCQKMISESGGTHISVNKSETKNHDSGPVTDIQQQRSSNTVFNQHQTSDEGLWQPGKRNYTVYTVYSGSQPDAMSRTHSTTRQTSYGRGITWSTTNPQISSSESFPNNIHNSQNQYGRKIPVSSVPPVSSTDPWYPGKLSNAVDEPNQQGLAGSQGKLISALSDKLLAVIILIKLYNYFL